MPNYCDCDLIVLGSKIDIVAFKKKAQSKERLIDANNFIPYPKKFVKLDKIAKEWQQTNKRYDSARVLYLNGTTYEDEPKDGYNQGGYEWCIKNWGTKWNLGNVNQEYEHTRSVMFSFETAWSPPIPVIRKMSEHFPALIFNLKYFEQGMRFQGVFSIKNSTILLDSHSEYRGHRGG